MDGLGNRRHHPASRLDRRSIAHLGADIDIATLAGEIGPINFRTLYVRGIRLIGSTLRSRVPQFKAVILAKLVAVAA